MKHLILYSFILLAFSCQKIVDMPITNGPQFEIHMDLGNGDSLNIVAGDDNVNYNAYEETRNGVKVYIGEFLVDGGNKKLKFEYYDHSNGYDYNEGVALLNSETTFANFSTQHTGYLFFDSSAIHGQNLSSVEWLVDGMSYNDNFHLVNEPGIYEVELKMMFNGQVASSLKNKVYLGYDNPCWGFFNVIDLGSGEYEFESQVQNENAVVKWIIDDTIQIEQNDLTHYLSSGLHKVGMYVSDNLGNEYYREKNIGNGASDYIGEFGFLKAGFDNLHNTVIVTYEENGVVYTSELLNQSNLNSEINFGDESNVLETADAVVLRYLVDMNFSLLNQNDVSEIKPVTLSGKIGFLVEK